MRLFGFEITRAKAAATSMVPSGSNAWLPLFRVREPFSGAWQRNISLDAASALAHHAVYTCVTLISSDIGKLRPRMVELGADGVWSETSNRTYTSVLMRPNQYQNHIQFKEWWITSKLLRGNAYALKERDRISGNVTALHLLDPARVKILVTPNGRVFYQVSEDNLAGITDTTVEYPASEIIHDRMNCLFHPLVGVSPIFASGMAADIGLTVQSNSADFFANGSNPSGVLTVPTMIKEEEADKIRDKWSTAYNRENSGKIPILPLGMKFEPMRMNAVDSQMIEHLKWSAETVASTFHVPAFKIGVGEAPNYNNGELLDQRYYSDCLQSLIEQWEACMDEGLGLMQFGTMGVELDLDGLLRMDSATQTKELTEGIRGGLYAPNEARKKQDLKPLKGGDTIYLQHQDYPIEMLAEREPPDAPRQNSATPEVRYLPMPQVKAAVQVKTAEPDWSEVSADEWSELENALVEV